MNPAMIEALQAYNANPPSSTGAPVSPADMASLDNAAEGEPISHEQVVEISRHLRNQTAPREELGLQSRGRRSYHLDDLLRGSRVYIAAATPKAEPVGHGNLRIYEDMLKYRLLDTRI